MDWFVEKYNGSGLMIAVKSKIAEADKAVLVEIARNVIELRKMHLKIDEGTFKDPRVEIIIEDGRKYLEHRTVFLATIPTYPMVLWSEDDFRYVRRKYKKIAEKTKHYNPEVHFSAFMLPEWLKKEVKDAH